ncbi:MAG: MFS transporter [Lacunisphaera sp.]|nr:MFS transporter [Lacunisphaera sp.]
MTTPISITNPTLSDDGLEPRLQTHNVFIFASSWALTFLAAPVLYVGFVQAALCKRLHTSDTVANLPSSVYLAMAWFPVVIAWLVPQVRLLKTTMSIAYGAMALASGMVAVVLLAQAPSEIIIAALIAHAAVTGCAGAVTFTFGWEALNRGASGHLRGKALGLAFGCGPGFAVIGSLGAQLLLEGKLFGWQPPTWMSVAYPYSYALLFVGCTLAMTLAAFLMRIYRIPLPKIEAERESFNVAVLGGFNSILSHRVLFIACAAYLLVYCGNLVQINMSLFTKEAVGRMSEELAGYQLALRFSFKMLTGILLGWVLTRTNPKVPLLITIGLQIAGILWVLFVPGYWFLLAFGINGAGELFGVYYVNYPVACSPKAQVRRNVAFLMLFSSLVGFAPVLYGWIADTWGLRSSFWIALGVLTFTTALVVAKLPAHPQPHAET